MWTLRAVAVLALLLASCLPSSAADQFVWRKDKNTVDADITSWDLLKTLEHISEATGWHVFLEPSTTRTVSTKFKGRATDRALDLLLGDLGRALLPGTNGGPPRFLVFRSKEQNATRRILAAKKPKPIPDELIVTMKNGKSVEDLAKKLGAKVVGKSDGLHSGRLKFENEEAANAARESLSSNEDVSSTDPNFPVSGMPVPDGTGLPASQNLNLQPVKDGSGVIVGLIDTYVPSQGKSYDPFMLKSISVAGEAIPDPDRPGHGASMFQTILHGMSIFNQGNNSSGVRILPVDVYGPNATTTTYEVAEGIYQAMKNGATIINMSLGSDGDTPYLYQVIQAGSESGHIFVASAGNTPVTSPTFPAAYPQVIAVTAGVAPGQIASYANHGSFVDAMAPGSSVIVYNGQAWRVNGTSPAAAYLSGAIASTADRRGLPLSQAAASVQQALPPPKTP